MSSVLVDNLTGKTTAGNVTVTSEGGAATFQLQQGLAKAWVNFNGTTVTAATDLTGVRDSFNIASLVDNDPGDYTVNFSTNMLTADYAIAPTGGAQLFMNATYAASNCTVDNRNLSGTQTDGTNINVSIFGDLS